MAYKEPRRLRPYPKLRKRSGVRYTARGIADWGEIRQPRPRRHARPDWGTRTRFSREQYLESLATKDVRGSLQERILYKALIDRGYSPIYDFTFQTSQLGGRTELGGLVADFMFPDVFVIVQVQSYWHTVTLAVERRDDDQKTVLESMGYTVLDIWPEIIEDVSALDDWIDRNIKTLWGTSAQGLALSPTSNIDSYVSYAYDPVWQVMLTKLNEISEAL